MFRIDLATVQTAPITKLVWPTCEDVGGVRVIGAAPIWILDVTADETHDDPAPRRYLFHELVVALHIGLGEAWVDRELHLLAAAPTAPATASLLLRVNEIWECQASQPRSSRFEIVTETGCQHLNGAGYFVPRASRRLQKLWPPTSPAAGTA